MSPSQPDQADLPSDPELEKPSGHPKSVGRYEIAERLGKGAMGAVYRARDTMLHREVAIKLMAGDLVEDPNFRSRFEREARLVASISHPNVLMVHDLGYHTDGSPFMALELLSGLDLAQVTRTRPPGPDDSAAIILHVLAGLGRAHEAGIVHRDVKPANIFITTDGRVKVMDFGVAHLSSAALTATGTVLGTAHYMSPEQVGGRPVDGRADLFSVGCVLFELLASRKPFEADNMLGVLYQVASADPDFTQLPPSAAALTPILMRAMQKDPSRRFATAREFALVIQRHLRQNGVSAWARHLAETVDLGRDPDDGRPLAAVLGDTSVRPLAISDQPTLSSAPNPTVSLKNGAAEPDAATRGMQSAWVREEDPGLVEKKSASRNPSWRHGSAAAVALALSAAGLWWSQADRFQPGLPPSDQRPTAPPAQPSPAVSPGERTNEERRSEAIVVAATTDPPSPPSGLRETPRSAASGTRPSSESEQVPAREIVPPAAPDLPAPAPQPQATPMSAPATAPTPASAPDSLPSSAPSSLAAIPATPAPAAAGASTAASSPFVVGRTEAKGFDGRSVAPRARLTLRVEPDSPSPGGRGMVVVLLRNDGSSGVQVRQVVSTVVSGRDRATEPVSVLVEVKPGEESTLLRRPVRWPQTAPWSMEVVVHTRTGESYTNRVTWK